MILTFKVGKKCGQIEISDIIMKEVVKIVDAEDSLYDDLDEFFQSALRKEAILNIREQTSKTLLQKMKEHGLGK